MTEVTISFKGRLDHKKERVRIQRPTKRVPLPSHETAGLKTQGSRTNPRASNPSTRRVFSFLRSARVRNSKNARPKPQTAMALNKYCCSQKVANNRIAMA